MALRQSDEGPAQRNVRSGRLSVRYNATDRGDLVLTKSRRPGVLVLINDSDWELEGEANYELQPNDNIVFVSTLHGG